MNEVILGAAFTGVGMLISRGIDVLKARRQENRDDQKLAQQTKDSETSQALGMYKDLIIGLKADHAELVEYIKVLENDRLVCREQLASVKAENNSLRADKKAS